MLTRAFKKFVYIVTNIFIYILLKSRHFNTTKKNILIIRTDAIGDYILFRNFIEILSQDEKYKGYEITLVGNEAWKDLALKYDSKFISKFIWVNRRKYTNDLKYRFNFLKNICSEKYDTLIYPVYSREFLIGDFISGVISAKNKVASTGNLNNISLFSKKIGDLFYTQLIPAENKVLFEFYRNKEFIENLLHQKIGINAPYITPLSQSFFSTYLPKKYVVLFIGASTQNRKWPIHKFLELANIITQKTDFDIILCGSNEDQHNAMLFRQEFKKPFCDFVGKTSLSQLISIISDAAFVVSNETSAAHFSAILQIPTVVIYCGSHYGRFAPYPTTITSKYALVCHPKIYENIERYKALSNTSLFYSKLDINAISVDDIWNAILELKILNN